MKKTKTIVFTGGGSGGHVVPALTLIKRLCGSYNIVYIGSIRGIERRLVDGIGLEYRPIPTGKLRRYLSFQNLLDIANVFAGIVCSFCVLLRFDRRILVFSMGGYVALPVVIAAYFQRKDIFVHEQTSRIGLANRIASFFATKVYVSFEESLKLFPEGKALFSGYPVKDECYEETLKQNEVCGIDLSDHSRPVIFVTGGGNGSVLLNEKVGEELDVLRKHYTIFHQVGKDYINEYKRLEDAHYRVFAFLGEGMVDLLKRADVVLSRAGAGTVCELLTLGKRSIFVPLKIAQKNEQFHNACQAQDILGSIVVEEDDFKRTSLKDMLKSFLGEQKQKHRKNPYKGLRGTDFLVGQIEAYYK